MWMLAALLFFQAAGAPGAKDAPANQDGMKALEEGRYEAAAEAFRQAIRSDPSDFAAHFNLGLAYGLLKKDEDGIQEYRKALELRPGLYEAQLNEGILLLRQGKPAEAVPLCPGLNLWNVPSVTSSGGKDLHVDARRQQAFDG